MAIVDPKTYMKKAQEIDDTDTQSLQEQVATLAAQVQAMTTAAAKGGGIDANTLEAMLSRVALMTAAAQDRLLHPDNREHPGISCYSYPEGDLKRPRPELKMPMTWVGYPLTTDTLTYNEIALLNQAEPGEYTFLRTDKTMDRMVVEADRDNLGRPTRLRFAFEVKERRDTLPSMVDQLRVAFSVKSPEQEELERLRAEVERLKAQPVGA